MKKKKAQMIRGSHLTDLLRDPGCIVDEKLSQSMPWPVYSLPDGRILIMLGKRRGCLWMSRRDVEELNRETTVENSLAEYAFGSDFLGQLPGLLEETQRVLSLPVVTPLNLYLCMQCLDEAIQKLGPRKCLKKDMFPMVLAYAGEILRIGLPGEWRLQVNALDASTLEPWIYGNNGKMCPLAGALSKELYEYGRKGSVLAVLRIYLAN